jgi:hypothetical protein
MGHLGVLAEIFDAIRDLPAVKAWSREHLGDEAAWEKKVRAGLIDEMARLGEMIPTMPGFHVAWHRGPRSFVSFLG